ncbi:MAG: DNA-directed RNA polymerase subunit omega [Heliobacteriaceae bacterium]|nr:DNA-directed RNA polymerase subunit omega [Heliobacteriaceae bacterium]MDD4586976.1 DNA-directed RNA polymerase subunit omega [Heliobacteriaceae bacterium]
MNRPSLDSLMGKVESKYALVVLAAKRARELTEKANPLVDVQEHAKPVSIALHEIAAGKIYYDELRGGIK